MSSSVRNYAYCALLTVSDRQSVTPRRLKRHALAILGDGGTARQPAAIEIRVGSARLDGEARAKTKVPWIHRARKQVCTYHTV